MARDLGTGITLTAPTSSWTCQITSLDPADWTRAAIKTSHMATTTGHTYVPGDLVDYGSVNVEFWYDPEIEPPIDGVAETWCITFDNGERIVFAGFMTNFQANAPMEEYMSGTATIKVAALPVIYSSTETLTATATGTATV